MLRPGVGRWDISGGQVIKDDIQDEPNLFQASYYYGLNNYLTGYTGINLLTIITLPDYWVWA